MCSAHILVSGLVNIETTLKVDAFPVPYAPVRYPFFGVNNTVSGVGYNVAKALTVLGDRVSFATLIGRDGAGKLIQEVLSGARISNSLVLSDLEKTPQSVILYDTHGRRQINVDLKDIQDKVYPLHQLSGVISSIALASLCNINFSRQMLNIVRSAGKWIATDVHALSNLEDEYNRDFMRAADILFMSNEYLPVSPEEWARAVIGKYGNEILVIGLGAEGALLYVKRDQRMLRVPAVVTRPVVSTIGAGDALFSCFIHEFVHTKDPYLSIRKAVLFASYKIGEAGAADGFLSSPDLEQLYVDNQVL